LFDTKGTLNQNTEDKRLTENKRKRKVGLGRGLLYGMHRERGNPPKIPLKLFDIRLKEYETGMLKIKYLKPA